MDRCAVNNESSDGLSTSSASVVMYGGPNCIIMPNSVISETSVSYCNNGDVNNFDHWNSASKQDGISSLFSDMNSSSGKDNQLVSLVHESSATVIKNENSTECTFLCNHCGEKFAELSAFAQHVCILTGERALSPCALPLDEPYLNFSNPSAESCLIKSEPQAQLLTLPTTVITIAAPSLSPETQQPSLSPPSLVAAPVLPQPPNLIARPKLQKIAKQHTPTAIITVNQPSSSTTSRDRPYICQLCGKSYTSANGLIIHERRHAGERPYLCQYCSKSFPDSSSCSRHERIHTGERPYVCEFCGRAFNDSSHLVTHRRKHTGERPYPCTQCQKAFFKSSDLKRHLRTHLSERHHPCGKCDKTFKEATALARHQRVHDRERSFACETCNKSFFDKSSCIRHARIHSTERAWKCEVCNKSFFEFSTLKRHALTHNSGDNVDAILTVSTKAE